MPLTIEHLKEAHASLLESGASNALFFILRDKKGQNVEYTAIKSRIAGELGKGFREVLGSVLSQLCVDPELEISEYDPSYIPDRHAVEYISTNDIPQWATIYDQVIKKIAPDEVEYDSKFFKRLWAYCIRTEVDGKTYLYFRKYSQTRVLRLGGRLSFNYSEGTFSHLKGDIFPFDESVDCVLLGEQMLVLNKGQFEHIFSFFEKYKSLADATLKLVKESGVVLGWDELQAACMSDPRKLKKLADIGKYIDIERLDFERLKKVASEWSVDVDVDAETKQFSAKGRKVWGLIKLLSDDLLQSPLTQIKYVVTSKKKS